MQKSIYGKIELRYDGDTLTAHVPLGKRIGTLLMSGFWVCAGWVFLMAGIHLHRSASITIGLIVLLVNGIILYMNSSLFLVPVVFDRKAGAVKRGSKIKPLSELTKINVEQNGATFFVWLVYAPKLRQSLGGLHPYVDEAEALRLAKEISAFTGVAIGRSVAASLKSAPATQPQVANDSTIDK